MRVIPVLLLALALVGCDIPDSPDNTAARGAISSRERSLIYAADGAAQQGNYAAAERDYLAAIAEDSGHVDAHLGLAQLYLKNNQADQALPVLEQAVVRAPDHALASYLIGKLYLNEGRYADAATAFDRGLTHQPDNLDLATGKGVVLDMQGNHAAAQMQYLRAIRTNSKATLTNVRTNLAMSYLLAGEPQKAVDLLKAEGTKAGAPAVTRHNLALAYGLLGQHAQAKKLLNGEMDEATRQLALGRMREYNEGQGNGTALNPLKAVLGSNDTSAAKKSVKPAAKPVAKPVAAPLPTTSALVDAAKKSAAAK